jgi:ABC-type dipeptide/oligopeptide/nickel transport system permease subunit
MTQAIETIDTRRPAYLRVVGAVSAAHFVSHYYILVLAPLLPFVRAEYGVSYTEIGLALTAFNTVSAALQTPAGFLVDRLGARRAVAVGLGAAIIGTCLAAATQGVAMLAVALVILPHYVRLARAAVITETSKDYVTAARVSGAGTARLMFKEVLPNCTAPLIVQASLGISTAILDAAALGFLGLGAQPPSPEWGTMLADAREFVLRAWWVVTFPGLAILVTVLAFNLLGDGLRDAFDPKLKR